MLSVKEKLSVIKWIQEHPSHWHDCDHFDGSPSYIWHKYCADPSYIIEHSTAYCKCDIEITPDNACTYQFRDAAEDYCRCNNVCLPGGDKCEFHEAFIFSDKLHDILNEEQEQLDNAD